MKRLQEGEHSFVCVCVCTYRCQIHIPHRHMHRDTIYLFDHITHILYPHTHTLFNRAGAGPSWHGCSAVHTHMTNTRITDPEIFERRYPVLLRQFSVRGSSGGKGLYMGGDGAIREIEFTKVYHRAISYDV